MTFHAGWTKARLLLALALVCATAASPAIASSPMGSRIMRGRVPFRKEAEPFENRRLDAPAARAVNPEKVSEFLDPRLAPDRRLPPPPGPEPRNPGFALPSHREAAPADPRPPASPLTSFILGQSGAGPEEATEIVLPSSSRTGLQLAQAPAPVMPAMPPKPGSEPLQRPDEQLPPGVRLAPPTLPPGQRPPQTARAASANRADEETSPVDLDQLVTLDLRDTDIKQFIKILSEQTRTNWIFDPALQGKINMLGPQEMSLREAQFLLKSILEYKGFTIEAIGPVRRIVPRTEGKWRNTELRLRDYEGPEGSPLAEDRLITQMVRLQYRNVNEIRGILVNFAKDAGAILPYTPTNALFITDNGTYIHRLMQIVEELDRPTLGKTLEIVNLRYAFAKTVMQPLNQILGGSSAPAEGAKPPQPQEGVPPPPPVPGQAQSPQDKPVIIPDDADNRLFVIAYPDDHEYIRRIVAELDQDPQHLPIIRIVPLRYSNPENVANLLREAYKQDPGITGSIKAFTVNPDKRTGSLMMTTYSPRMMDQVLALVQKLDVPVVTAGSAIRVYRLEFAEAKKIAEVLSSLAEGDEQIGAVVQTGVTTGAAIVPGVVSSAREEDQKAKKASIIADEATNSLVIIATLEKFNQIRAVIKELDVVRPQVLVEVLIARIDVTHSKHLGLDFNAVSTSGSGGRPFAIGSTGNLAQLFSVGGVRQGLNLGILDGGDFDIAGAASGNIGELSKIGLLINLLQNDDRANILSAPKLLTADNEEANITVGQQVRIPQGSTLNAINTITNFVTEDLGIILELTPRITKNDFVTMKIRTQIRNLIPDQTVAGIPIISNSDVATNISVKNRETIVMGGLIQEEERHNESRIPLLGDLPLIGKLFRDTETSKIKQNLLIFMTPHIIRTSTAATAATRRVSPVLRHVDIKAKRRAPHLSDPSVLLNEMNRAR